MDVFTLVAKWGISTIVLAAIIICLLGVLKLCKVFTKIKSADARKIVYSAIQLVFAFGFSALYFVIFRIPFTVKYVGYSIAVTFITIVGYHYYETYGIRKCVRWLLGLFAKWFASKKPEEAINKSLKKLGLTEEQCASVNQVINTEVAKLEAEVKPVENPEVIIPKID